jgi:hypothetical protein
MKKNAKRKTRSTKRGPKATSATNRQVTKRKSTRSTFRANPSYGIISDPFPRSLRCRLKYTYGRTLNSGTTQSTFGSEVVFRLSSIYDPLYSGTIIAANNKTVVGHSELAAIYTKYLVTGALVNIMITDPSSDGIMVGFNTNQAVALQGNHVRLVNEHSMTTLKPMHNTGNQKVIIKRFVRPWQLAGLSKLEWAANRSDHSSAMNNNPSSPTFCRIALANTASTSDITARFDIEILYYVQLFDRKQLVSSYF